MAVGLTPFGQLVEELREHRGASKQWLAEQVGVSRSTWYRILTGAADITRDQMKALAGALHVPMARLLEATTAGQWEPETRPREEEVPSESELADFMSNTDRIVRSLRELPGGPVGKPIKIALLNSIASTAREKGDTLPRDFYDIMRRVDAGEL